MWIEMLESVMVDGTAYVGGVIYDVPEEVGILMKRQRLGHDAEVKEEENGSESCNTGRD